jgi:hypothetical protein
MPRRGTQAWGTLPGPSDHVDFLGIYQSNSNPPSASNSQGGEEEHFLFDRKARLMVKWKSERRGDFEDELK